MGEHELRLGNYEGPLSVYVRVEPETWGLGIGAAVDRLWPAAPWKLKAKIHIACIAIGFNVQVWRAAPDGGGRP